MGLGLRLKVSGLGFYCNRKVLLPGEWLIKENRCERAVKAFQLVYGDQGLATYKQ